MSFPLLALALAALGLNLSIIHQAKAAGFVSVSPMIRGRNYHTATLLANGKVLVAGGNGDTIAELFDPATETWTLTGSLHTYRAGHSATLLPNGKVLIAGGEGGAGVLRDAELYNPATGTWTVTSSLNTARELHTATLLPNGKVLVAGGFGTNYTSLSNAELYDPANSTWMETGFLRHGRDNHEAVLLTDGTVLVAGGYDRSTGAYLSSAELYDPTTGIWTETGTMHHARSGHEATLLPNGTVLVSGGPAPTGGGYLSSTELYDPDRRVWTETGPLTNARWHHTATLLPNGRVLAAGGVGARDLALSSAELYDPATGTWAQTGSLNIGRFGHKATLLLNGNVLVTGGTIPRVGFAYIAEIYGPDSDGAAPSLTILHQANQIMSFYWRGAGILEQSDSLTFPNWQPAITQDNPHIITTTEPMKFFRVEGKTNWRFVSKTGNARSSVLYVFLSEAGSVYLDQIHLVAGDTPEVGENLVRNGDFESDLSGPWIVPENYAATSISSEEADFGEASLHLVANGPPSRTTIVQQELASIVTNGLYTLSFWYLSETNSPTLTVRLSDNSIGANSYQ